MDREIKNTHGVIWEDVLDSLPGFVVILDNDGHMLYMNSYGENLYSVRKDQYIGKHCLEGAESFMSDRMKGLIGDLLENGEPHKTISKLEMKDNQLFTTV